MARRRRYPVTLDNMVLVRVRRHASDYNAHTRAIHAAGMPVARGDAWNMQWARVHDRLQADAWANQAAWHGGAEI